MIVYKTTNLINNKIYIGLDSKNNEKYFGSGTLLNKAINKYGKENFKKEILEECNNIKKLKKREKYWIKKLKSLAPNGYNITEGGDGSFGWLKHHPNCNDIKLKIGKSKIGNKNCVGRVVSEKTIKKMSMAKIGKTYEEIFGENTGKKLREIKRKNWLNNKNPKFDGNKKEDNPFWNKKHKKSTIKIISKKVSEKLKGRKQTEEEKEKHRIGALNRKKLTCPYCKKTMDVSNAKGYHFDKCKYKNQNMN